ncbi:MAG: sugar phosphate isomerase/epimerase [Clostridia bacterium]|nr:sugar phosphate isomerase/epimerase [Clostridia bacterium]
MPMKIGIGPCYFRSTDGTFDYDAGALRMLSHGYRHLDFDWYANTENELYAGDTEEEFIQNTLKWKEKLTKHGLIVHQVHGPWCGDIHDKTPEGRAERFEKMSKCLQAASLLGARYMAIHPIMPFGSNSPDHPERLYEMNYEFFTRLADVAERYGTVICLENMPFTNFPLASVPSLLALIRDIGRDNVRMCLDTGHANIFPLPLGDCVRLIGKEDLKILHVHDNMGVQDEHLHPYCGTADFDGFSDALEQIGFDGVVNLECSVRPTSYHTHEQRVERELALAERVKRIAKWST